MQLYCFQLMPSHWHLVLRPNRDATHVALIDGARLGRACEAATHLRTTAATMAMVKPSNLA